ncbi:MAG TPA: tRNA (adenosine(37)-N6)-dimethylallyltransferase MiaA [Candidatus Scatomonas pullistercoris]|uniref:tRNA dimethylallyltransferase n=1 Tax=Candidatus Scatomonas pullistercoris TaxID=2840920 RepID=A0A9D1P0U5_9FIRM|nr:tRNA (adenosine(37)-N6)-dimethylallyltransferase MiaA [Candidatus Scatomonas pullistercoris]
MKQPCIILTGPTAVGKTRLSLALSRAVKGSVISADSMQVYKGMDIGSAKIMPWEMEGIPHYLIDVLEPEEEFHVARFQEMARAAMREIYAVGRIPIITGGTGFYIQALLKNVDFSDSSGESPLRAELSRLAAEKGDGWLYRMLQERDPEAAAAIHPHNRKRVIRALEFCMETGQLMSAHNQRERQRESPYCYAYFVLNDDREKLYRQIDLRVDGMIRQGLVEEVRRLAGRGLTEENTSMKGLGYKELFPYLRGEISLEEAVRIIKRDTRHFAKRQLTWFRREPDVVWVNKPDFDYDEDRILKYILSVWQEKVREEDGK